MHHPVLDLLPVYNQNGREKLSEIFIQRHAFPSGAHYANEEDRANLKVKLGWRYRRSCGGCSAGDPAGM